MTLFQLIQSKPNESWAGTRIIFEDDSVIWLGSEIDLIIKEKDIQLMEYQGQKLKLAGKIFWDFAPMIYDKTIKSWQKF